MTCWAGSRPRGRRCCWPPWTASPTARCRPGPNPPRACRHAPKVTVADARVDWAVPALAVDRLIRSVTPVPAPGRRSAASGSASARSRRYPTPTRPALKPGELHVEKRRVLVGTGAAPLALGEVRPVGKRAMPGARLGPGRPHRAQESCSHDRSRSFRHHDGIPVTGPRHDGPRREGRRQARPAGPHRSGRPAAAPAPRPGPRSRTRPGRRPSSCSPRYGSATPTPTSPCPRSCAATACATATPAWPPSSATARCGRGGCSTP